MNRIGSRAYYCSFEPISLGFSLWSRTKHPTTVYSSAEIKYLFFIFSGEGSFHFAPAGLFFTRSLAKVTTEKLTIVHFLLPEQTCTCYIVTWVSTSKWISFWQSDQPLLISHIPSPSICTTETSITQNPSTQGPFITHSSLLRLRNKSCKRRKKKTKKKMNPLRGGSCF